MTDQKYDYIVFVGKFQPLHLGHKEVLDFASAHAKHVIVIVGSDKQPRTTKNPFTTAERASMISYMGYSNVSVVGVRDQLYSDQRWVESVQDVVSHNVSLGGWADYPPSIGIIGHEKDETSYYLKMFPQWELIEYPLNERINATDIRQLLFERNSLRFIRSVVPDNVFMKISEFCETEDYERLVKEYQFIKTYKKSWEAVPYPPTFVTADAVVIQSGHVLLVKRRAEPGKGLWALPGGFVNQFERIENAMIRELREETKLKVPEPVLRGSISKSHVFDHPSRSERGRTITHAFNINLQPGPLPPVKGSDDAEKARWVPLSEINSEEMFEDHYSIITFFIN